MGHYRVGFLILFLSMIGYGQSRVDIRTQAKGADFSGFSATKPFKASGVLPATCSVGEMFYNSSAPAGSNLYGCTAPNTWTLEGGGGAGAAVASQLGDLQVSLSSSTTLSIGSHCTASTPCNVRFGSMLYTFAAGATATIAAGTGMAYAYVSNDGHLMVGHSMTVSCSPGCVAQNGVSAFPPDSIPLATWSATNGAWDSTGGTDWRAFQSTTSISAGVGLTTVTNWGNTQIGVDTGAVGLRVAVPSTATDTCAAGTWAMDASWVYQCYATNTWKTVPLSTWKTIPGGSTLTVEIPTTLIGTSDAPSPVYGDWFLDPTSGSAAPGRSITLNYTNLIFQSKAGGEGSPQITSVIGLFLLPENWASGSEVDLKVTWDNSSWGNGTATFGAQLACTAATGSGDLHAPPSTFNTSTVMTATQLAYDFYTTKIASLDTSNCVAGGYMWVRFFHDGTAAGAGDTQMVVYKLTPLIRVNVQ